MKRRRYSGASVLNTMLLRRKGGYRLLFLAVLLSTFLAGATVLMISTGVASYFEMNYTRYGEADAVLHDVPDGFLRDAAQAELIEPDYGLLSLYGYVLPDGETQEGGFALAAMDKNAEKLAHRKLVSGRMPERVGEIAVERIALKKAGLLPDLGQNLTLAVALPDGEGGFLPEPACMTFTLVGVLEDQGSYLSEWSVTEPVYQDFPAALVSPEEPMPAGGAFVKNALLRETAGANNATSRFFAFCSDWGDRAGVTVKVSWVSVRMMNFGDNGNIVGTVIVVVMVMAVLLLLCGFGIVAAFSTTIEERTRQLGLLRAVGATGQQIRSMLLRQTFTLAIAALPLGLGLACLAVWGLVKLLGDFFVFALNPWSLLIAVAVMLASVFAASWIPAAKAARISPMQAIRDVEMQWAMARSPVKSAKVYRPARHMALRSLSLHKGQWGGIAALTVVAVLLISVFIPLTAVTLERVSSRSDPYDYRLWVWKLNDGGEINYQYPTKILPSNAVARVYQTFPEERIVTAREVKVQLLLEDFAPYLKEYTNHRDEASNDQLRRDLRDFYAEAGLETRDRELYTTGLVSLSDPGVYAADDKIVLEGAIHPDKLASGEEVLICAPNWATRKDRDGSIWTFIGTREYLLTRNPDVIHENDVFHAGDTLTLSFVTSPDAHTLGDGTRDLVPEHLTQQLRTVKIGAVISDGGVSLTTLRSDIGTVYTVDSALDAWGWEKSDVQTLGVALRETPSEELENYYNGELQDIADVTDQAQFENRIELAAQSRRNNRTLILVASGLALVFFAASAAMVNRTLSAQIRNGTRTIGMMRAVGADRTTVTRMFGHQALYVLFGSGLVALVLCVAWLLFLGEDWPVKTTLPIALATTPAYLAALLGLCLTHIHSQIGRVYRKSVTENIREL